MKQSTSGIPVTEFLRISRTSTSSSGKFRIASQKSCQYNWFWFPSLSHEIKSLFILGLSDSESGRRNLHLMFSCNLGAVPLFWDMSMLTPSLVWTGPNAVFTPNISISVSDSIDASDNVWNGSISSFQASTVASLCLNVAIEIIIKPF